MRVQTVTRVIAGSTVQTCTRPRNSTLMPQFRHVIFLSFTFSIRRSPRFSDHRGNLDLKRGTFSDSRHCPPAPLPFTRTSFDVSLSFHGVFLAGTKARALAPISRIRSRRRVVGGTVASGESSWEQDTSGTDSTNQTVTTTSACLPKHRKVLEARR